MNNINEVPLQYPLYGASFGQAVSRFFSKYATFKGRASRSEFWWSWLFIWAVDVVGGILLLATSPNSGTDGLSGFGIFLAIVIGVFSLAVIIPMLAVTVRRLHDANFSGAFWFLNLIPGGSLAVFILCAMPSVPEGARFD